MNGRFEATSFTDRRIKGNYVNFSVENEQVRIDIPRASLDAKINTNQNPEYVHIRYDSASLIDKNDNQEYKFKNYDLLSRFNYSANTFYTTELVGDFYSPCTREWYYLQTASPIRINLHPDGSISCPTAGLVESRVDNKTYQILFKADASIDILDKESHQQILSYTDCHEAMQESGSCSN